MHTHTHTHTTEAKHEAAPGSEKPVLRDWHGFYRLGLKSLCSVLHHSVSIYATGCILHKCGGIHSYILTYVHINYTYVPVHINYTTVLSIHLDSCVNDTPWNCECCLTSSLLPLARIVSEAYWEVWGRFFHHWKGSQLVPCPFVWQPSLTRTLNPSSYSRLPECLQQTSLLGESWG